MVVRKVAIVAFVLFTLACRCDDDNNVIQLDYVYHNYDALTSFLHNVSIAYPDLTHLYSIGKSVQGRELWVLAVSTTPDRHVIGKPEVKLVGNIHGNEAVGREILLHFILHLVTRYGRDDLITRIVEESRVHVLPSMNPDGFEKTRREGSCTNDRGRRNHNGYDLNRNFPDHFERNDAAIQPETRAVMDWMSEVAFVLSAGLHGGALVASYPYENHNDPIARYVGRIQHPSPDDDVFRHMAAVYASHHATMWLGRACRAGEDGFPGGITNGAEWYIIKGSMQDYNYIFHGAMEVTLEVSCCKYPLASTLERHWLDNKDALKRYVLEAQRGVKGLVVDSTSARPVSDAQLKIKGRHGAAGFRTTRHGEFWRILLAGNYTLQITHHAYQSKEVPFTVSDSIDATRLDVALAPLGEASTRKDKRTHPVASKSVTSNDEYRLVAVRANVTSSIQALDGFLVLGLLPKSRPLPHGALELAAANLTQPGTRETLQVN